MAAQFESTEKSVALSDDLSWLLVLKSTIKQKKWNILYELLSTDQRCIKIKVKDNRLKLHKLYINQGPQEKLWEHGIAIYMQITYLQSHAVYDNFIIMNLKLLPE